MFRQFVALVRGQAHEAAEVVVDANALVILRQQLRDCAAAVDVARKSVAIATAETMRDRERLAGIEARIADLEERTLAALGQGKADLAREGAEAIAALESERAATAEATRAAEAEIERLRQALRRGRARVADLERGLRLAEAGERTRRLRGDGGAAGLSSLRDAEATLDRLKTRQRHAEAVDRAMEEVAGETDAGAVASRLAAAGCGKPACRNGSPAVPDRRHTDSPARPPHRPVSPLFQPDPHDGESRCRAPHPMPRRIPAPGRCSPWGASSSPRR